MRKHSLLLRIAFVSLLFLVLSCEEDQVDNVYVRSDYLGTWTCREFSGPLAPQVYTVQIVAGVSAEDVIIEGLANQGSSFTVRGNVDFNGIFIPSQTQDAVIISGQLTYNQSIPPLNLTYTWDDGSGETEINGELTR